MKAYFGLKFLLLLLLFGCNDTPTPPIDLVKKAGFCLTFDDTYIKNWNNILPLLDSNDVKATFFITQIYKISKEEIDLLKTFQDKGHEIGCHGWQHIDALKYLENHTLQNYFNIEIKPALDFMNNINLYPTSFSYPNGYNCDSLNSCLLNTFNVIRDITDEQRRPLEKNIKDIDEICFCFDKQRVISSLGIDKNFNISLDMIEEGLKRAANKNEVIVFYSHNPVKTATASYQIEYQYLRELFSLTKKYNLKSYTFSEMIE